MAKCRQWVDSGGGGVQRSIDYPALINPNSFNQPTSASRVNLPVAGSQIRLCPTGS